MAFRLPGQNRFKPNKARPRPPATSQPSQPSHEAQIQPKPSSTVASVPPPLPATKDASANVHHAPSHTTTGASDESSQIPDLTQATTQATQDTVIATPPRPSKPIDPAPVFGDSQSTHHPLDDVTTPGPSRPKQVQGEDTRHAHSARPSPSGRHPSSSAAHVEKGNFALTEKDKSPPYSPQPRSGSGGRGPMARISGSPAVRSRSLTPSTPLVNRGVGPSALLKAAAAQAESGFSRPSPGRIPSRKSRSGRSDTSRATSVAPSMPPADTIAPIAESAEGVVERPAVTESESAVEAVEAEKQPEAPPTPLRQQASREEMRARIQAKVSGTKMGRPSMSRENSWSFAPSEDRAASKNPDPTQIQSISSVLAEASSVPATGAEAPTGTTGTTKQSKGAKQVTRSEVPPDAGLRRSPSPSSVGEANDTNQMDIDVSGQQQPMSPSGIFDRNAETARAVVSKAPTADRASLESVPTVPQPRQATPSFSPERSPTPSHTVPQDAETSHAAERPGPFASAHGQDGAGAKKQARTKAKSKKKSTQDQEEDSTAIDGEEATVQKKKPRRKTGAVQTAEETDQSVADDAEGDRQDETGDDGKVAAPSGTKKGKKRKSVNRVRSESKKAKKTVQFTQAGIKDLVAGDTLGEEVLNVDDLTMADLAINITSGTISARGISSDDFMKATKKQAAEQSPYRRWTRWEKEQIYRRHVRRRANAERHTRRQEAAAKGSNPDEEVSPDEDDSEEEFEIVPDRFTPPPEDQQVERIQPLSLNPAGDEAAGGVEGEDVGQEAPAGGDLYDQYAEEEEVDEDNMDVNPDDVAEFPSDEHDYEPAAEEDDTHGFNVVDDLPAEGADYYAGSDRNGEEDDEGYAGAGDQYYEQFLDDPTQTYLDQREHARDEHRRRQENVEALYEDDNTKMVNSRTYSKVRKSERWTKTETNFFFDTASPEAGENPFMSQAYFPGRTHQQLKNKMNREYKANKERYLAASDNKRRVDTVYLEKAAGFDSQKDYGDEIAWSAQLKEDAKKLTADKPPAHEDEAMSETFDEEKEDEGVDKEEWGGEDEDGDGKHDPYEYPDYDNENYEEGEGEKGEVGGHEEDEEDIDIDPEEG